MRSLKDPRIPRQDHLDLATHFYVDRYATMAQVERSWGNTSRPVSDYLCSYCLTPHNKSAFDTDELAKGPEERACIGAIGSIHTCAHRGFTHMQLLLAMRGKNRLELCTHTDHDLQGAPSSSETPTTTRKYLGDTLRFRRGLKMTPAPHNRPGEDTYICPHLRTSSKHR
jgi:hypothetical protein